MNKKPPVYMMGRKILAGTPRASTKHGQIISKYFKCKRCWKFVKRLRVITRYGITHHFCEACGVYVDKLIPEKCD